VELCRRVGVLRDDCVAIDGSKFKAVNNRDKNFTKGKIASRITHLEANIARYLEETRGLYLAKTNERFDTHGSFQASLRRSGQFRALSSRSSMSRRPAAWNALRLLTAACSRSTTS
jgi:hypothetical protein